MIVCLSDAETIAMTTFNMCCRMCYTVYKPCAIWLLCLPCVERQSLTSSTHENSELRLFQMLIAKMAFMYRKAVTSVLCSINMSNDTRFNDFSSSFCV